MTGAQDDALIAWAIGSLEGRLQSTAAAPFSTEHFLYARGYQQAAPARASAAAAAAAAAAASSSSAPVLLDKRIRSAF